MSYNIGHDVLQNSLGPDVLGHDRCTNRHENSTSQGSYCFHTHSGDVLISLNGGLGIGLYLCNMLGMKKISTQHSVAR